MTEDQRDQVDVTLNEVGVLVADGRHLEAALLALWREPQPGIYQLQYVHALLEVFSLKVQAFGIAPLAQHTTALLHAGGVVPYGDPIK